MTLEMRQRVTLLILVFSVIDAALIVLLSPAVATAVGIAYVGIVLTMLAMTNIGKKP